MTQPRKMSEMILEMAAYFISQGKTPEEKHHRLTAACSAWNVACGTPEIQRQQLEQYVKGYRQNNPATSPSELANILKVMQSLIERKLELFPEDKRQIVGAQVVMVGMNYRIEVASATVQLWPRFRIGVSHVTRPPGTGTPFQITPGAHVLREPASQGAS